MFHGHNVPHQGTSSRPCHPSPRFWHRCPSTLAPAPGVETPIFGGWSIHGVHRVVCIYFVEIDLDVDVDVDVVNRNNVACSSNDDNCSM